MPIYANNGVVVSLRESRRAPVSTLSPLPCTILAGQALIAGVVFGVREDESLVLSARYLIHAGGK
jgi:hypothetical protein